MRTRLPRPIPSCVSPSPSPHSAQSTHLSHRFVLPFLLVCLGRAGWPPLPLSSAGGVPGQPRRPVSLHRRRWELPANSTTIRWFRQRILACTGFGGAWQSSPPNSQRPTLAPWLRISKVVAVERLLQVRGGSLRASSPNTRRSTASVRCAALVNLLHRRLMEERRVGWPRIWFSGHGDEYEVWRFLDRWFLSCF
ncbi:hypothetical protein BRADI_4g16715v3 [Brachypodium distachyon]|uniref:Uncharacterized protein n=1 Tax=Brachypodium distachyon TaxID=15368 RepID=A0A0Q3L6N7_BRADI|nr:hypothetical protein BRADI_4g16715v3 [Brachypodium distachyon]